MELKIVNSNKWNVKMLHSKKKERSRMVYSTYETLQQATVQPYEINYTLLYIEYILRVDRVQTQRL